MLRSRHLRLLLLLALVVTAVVIGTGALTGGGNSPTKQSDEDQVRAAVAAFSSAIANENWSALYLLQTSAYQLQCSEADFETVARNLVGSRFTDAKDVKLQLPYAAASVTVVYPNANVETALLTLVKEADGWRFQTEVTSGCGPDKPAPAQPAPGGAMPTP